MLAAQLIAAGRCPDAIRHFQHAVDCAERADSRPEALLASGFAALAALLDRPHDAEAAARLEQIRTALRSLENGPFFAEQVETAARVFGKPLASVG